jgi:hypothetical protein
VRVRFLQVAGTFSGELPAGGRAATFDGLPGVVEDQAVLW